MSCSKDLMSIARFSHFVSHNFFMLLKNTENLLIFTILEIKTDYFKLSNVLKIKYYTLTCIIAT